MAWLAAFIVNGIGAPQLSKLTECGAVELDEPKNYLGSFVLNNVFTIQYPDSIRRLTFMFGRRADNAVREYRAGRQLLLSYIERLPQGNNHFLVALRATTHFEHCVGSACQAIALLNRLIQVTNAQDYSDPSDKDDCELRLKRIWNRAKHFDEDLVGPKMSAQDITSPVWLTNTGLSAETATVTWAELHRVLTELQDTLKFFAEELPNKIVERKKTEGQAKINDE